MGGDIHFGDRIEVSGEGNIGKISYHSASQFAGCRELVDALRTDATTARGAEGQAARAYADDLEEALDAHDQSRVDRVIGRIRSLLDVVSSAFTLARGLPPLSG